jgi:predicted transcriptional regulator of viral defense system
VRGLELRKIQRLSFGHEEIARVLGITLASARVTASRYVKQGHLVRIKRNLYVLSEKWSTLDRDQQFLIANVIQVPSYISLMTALDFYQVTTQMQQNFVESICVKRTTYTEIEPVLFNYTRVQDSLYFGFSRKEGVFIAEPEKAFLDAIYLMSLGRYGLDVASIDLDKLDQVKVKQLSKRFPSKTQSFLVKNEYFRNARNL